MRCPSIAFYTLTAIALSTQIAQAGETPNPESKQTAIAPNVTLSTTASTTSHSVSIPANNLPTVSPPISSVETLTSKRLPTEISAAALLAPTYDNAAETVAPVSETAIADATANPDERIADSTVIPNSTVSEAKPKAATNCAAQPITRRSDVLAQATPAGRCPRPEAVAPVDVPEPYKAEASPALSLYIPVGFGADQNTVFVSGTYQNEVREDAGDVGSAGVGIGLGNASKTVGLELSYAFANNENFGEGGFNAKLHRRFGDTAVAAGWNGFLNIGRNDFEHSRYGVLTKVFRTSDSVDNLFSRVAVTVGVGDGQFRSSGAVDAGENNVNVFGNVAVRVARPVSLIAEWTGQDLGVGLSIAPFRNFPLVITPAVRDLAGSDHDPRFVLGSGVSFRF